MIGGSGGSWLDTVESVDSVTGALITGDAHTRDPSW